MTSPDVKGRDDLHIAHRLILLLGPHRTRMVGAIALMLVATGAILMRPQLVEYAVNSGVISQSPNVLAIAATGYMLVAGIEAGMTSWQRYILQQIGLRVTTDLRNRMFRHSLTMSHSFHDRHGPGDLISRVNADTEVLSDFVTWTVITALHTSLMLVGTIVLLFSKDVTLTIVTLAVVPVIGVLTRRWMLATRRRYDEAAAAVGSLAHRLQELLAGIRVIKVLGREHLAHELFVRANARLRTKHLDTARVTAGFFPMISGLSDVVLAIVLSLGGWQVMRDELDPGQFAAFILLVQRLFDPIREFSERVCGMQKAIASGGRIFQVLDEPATITDTPDAVDLPSVTGDIRLENVRFGYEKNHEPVLDGINLEIPARQTLALVGPTGAGKTSIVRLIGRFYDVDSGRVTIDGYDVRDVTLASLRRRIAWVPQEVGLFTGTVMDNLRYGAPLASDRQVRAAAATVGADEVFSNLPAGYDTQLEEGGENLSAGQRQLIAFTRAVLADPAVVVLDEATARVDPTTEARMHRGLATLLAGRTAIVIAHRLSTIVNADLIAVIDRGRVAEYGTHAELVRASGIYAGLYRSQVRSSRLSP